MRHVFFAILVAFLLCAHPASSLESGTVFSVEPGTGYKCVYVSLPQDLGVSYLENTTETIIEADREESPWVDLTYSSVVMEPGVLNKNPVCFYYTGKEEGDFSFYRIRLVSRDLGLSSDISGGFCVSDYEDVDTGVEVTNETDMCELMNENADIIDLSFEEDVTYAKPGEIVTKTLYVTSYANLRIRLSIATNLQNDFGEPVVTTSPSKPTAVKTFKVKVPEREGDFQIIVRAVAEGCDIQACRKQKSTTLSVTTAEKKGFTASVIPKNINLKEAQETRFRVVISNYDETRDFLIEVSPEPRVRVDPESKTIRVEKGREKTAVFSILPEKEKLYRIEFKITTEGAEKLLTSYISIGELLTDAIRYAETTEREHPGIREEIRNAREEYESRYNRTASYTEVIEEYEDFRNTLDDMKKKAEKPGEKPAGETEEGGGFSWTLIAVPLIVVVVLVLLFVAYKKTKVSRQEYSGYGYY